MPAIKTATMPYKKPSCLVQQTQCLSLFIQVVHIHKEKEDPGIPLQRPSFLGATEPHLPFTATLQNYSYSKTEINTFMYVYMHMHTHTVYIMCMCLLGIYSSLSETPKRKYSGATACKPHQNFQPLFFSKNNIQIFERQETPVAHNIFTEQTLK